VDGCGSEEEWMDDEEGGNKKRARMEDGGKPV
jgi:hypothetical protein